MLHASMAQRAVAKAGLPAARLKEQYGPRAIGLVVAFAIEALLLLLLLTLGQGINAPNGTSAAITSFDVRSPEESVEAEVKPEKEAVRHDATPQPATEQPPEAKLPDAPAMQQLAFVPFSRRDMDAANLANLPQAKKPEAPAEPAYGPQFTGSSDDSEVIGSASNGEPLYAARWYLHEPTREEMLGYISTTSGAGWATIECRTVDGWRVEDCVGLGEYPQGSQIQRAVLAAAWQFRIRPPKKGGRYLVGSWVRIRYTLTDH